MQAADSVFVLVEILVFVALLLVALVFVWAPGSTRLEIERRELGLAPSSSRRP